MDVLGPFQVLKRPLTLTASDSRSPPRDAGSGGTGPVAWWKLDETSGADAADASGHHRIARVQGQPRWAPDKGRSGGALELDGAKNSLRCGEAAEFDFRDAMSVSLWFKTRGSDKSSRTLVAKGGENWRLQLNGEKGTLGFTVTGPQATGVTNGRPTTITAKRAADDGQWHHVVALYDGKRVALYVDGEMGGSAAASGVIAVNTDPVTLGENVLLRGRSFDGWLDDVRLYDRGLSEAEVQALFRGGAASRASAK